MQVEASNGVRALIASTMPEVWQIIHSGVVEEGKVDDVSISFPSLSPILEPNRQKKRVGEGIENQEGIGRKTNNRSYIQCQSHKINWMKSFQPKKQ